MEDFAGKKAGGDWIKALREDWQLTAAELVEQVGAPSLDWLKKVESGESPIKAVFFEGFARSFNMTIADFGAAYNRAFFGDQAKAA